MVEDKQSVGKKFLELSAISVYGIWILIILFPLILAGILFLIDKQRSVNSLLLSSIALGIFAVSYILRFCMVRNTESIRNRVLQADRREQALNIIIGGFLWWLMTLVFAIIAVLSMHQLF